MRREFTTALRDCAGLDTDHNPEYLLREVSYGLPTRAHLNVPASEDRNADKQ
jgi:hypothetical protein